jgi:hypothetical protein
MVVLWNFSRIWKGCLWDSHWISIRFLCDLFGFSLVFLWKNAARARKNTLKKFLFFQENSGVLNKVMFLIW